MLVQTNAYTIAGRRRRFMDSEIDQNCDGEEPGFFQLDRIAASSRDQLGWGWALKLE